MFLDVNELAIHKLRLRRSYAPGAVEITRPTSAKSSRSKYRLLPRP